VRLVVQPPDDLAREPLPARGAGVEPLDVPDLARGVVIGGEPQRLGLDPEVHVLAHQDHVAVAPARAQLLRQREDTVVGLAERERLAHARGGGLAHLQEQPPAPLAERQAVGERPLAAQLVELADELPRLEVDQVVTALEAVELLQHDDAQRHVVLLEVVDAGVIEEDDVRVDHEELLHRSSLALPG
jgi:hypothetical protein